MLASFCRVGLRKSIALYLSLPLAGVKDG